MITASPGVIIAGAASGLLVVPAACSLHACGGGYALFAAIVAGARGAVFLVNGVRPAWAGRVSGSCAVVWPCGGMTRFSWPGGGTARLLPVRMYRRR